MPEAKGVLSHIKVLDLTTFLSGPFATQILGDLGAEVIKIEQIAGDDTRRLPPNFIGPDSAYFHSINRNKKSVSIDLRAKEGQELVRRLAADSDVVIENMRPGGAAKYGIDYDSIAKLNPRVVYASISGFGQDGPYRDQPAYDMVVQALSGGMSLTGEQDGRPVRSGIPIGDLAAEMMHVDHDVLHAVALQAVDRAFDHRAAGHGDQRLGRDVGQRPHALAAPCRQDHCRTDHEAPPIKKNQCAAEAPAASDRPRRAGVLAPRAAARLRTSATRAAGRAGNPACRRARAAARTGR